MGLISPELPDVDHDAWPALPRPTRLQIVTRHWVEHGFGTPYAVYLLYLIKIALYVTVAATVIAITPGLDGLGHIAQWWTQPIVYQKFVIFTLLFEVLGWAADPATHRSVLAADRRIPVLVAAQHHSAATLAGQDSAYGWRQPHACRRCPLCRRAGFRSLGTFVARARWSRH
ncbi:hypothetical protein I553_10061 [Mycobacterium xenopi 4042]|uniref:Uncharacterized protein n=1 Tax=Mycobacterium xenopi 4042 TaxID=1299334 RepID=X7YPG2_MYCXE|nr:hypothetical protein I553_10061 [Mycobacterium xenopi 4042]